MADQGREMGVLLERCRSFWGKARPVEGADADWHPLWMHALDVAAVARCLTAEFAPLFGRLASFAGWSQRDTGDLFVFLAALHDIGKFSRVFQKKAEAHWPETALGVLDNATRNAMDPGHPTTGLALFDHMGALCDAHFPGWEESDRMLILGAALGHHGRPARADLHLSADICRKGEIEAACEFVGAIRALLHPPRLSAPQDTNALSRASWIFAGLTVLADWIGSDQAFFPYQGASACGVKDYWRQAQGKAQRAVAHAGLAARSPGNKVGYRGLTGLAHPPSPLQAWAEQVALPPEPTLFLIEDMTGSGKTEAALILAQRLMAAGGARGLFFALPTMATANAAYERLAAIYRRLYAEGERPSLVLTHGRAALHEGFADSILDLKGRRAGRHAAEDADSAAESTAWLASESRKALLADVGVGTIDQALLAVLPARYQALRLLGLAGKVLVIDEAHAYDAYMSKELARLAAFQAYLGSSVIILSATLPRAVKQGIMDEWRRAGGGMPCRASSGAYPLATVVPAMATPEEAASAPRPDLPRSIAVERLPDAAAAVEAIARAAEAGAAVAWIRNTVDDVLEGAGLLRRRGLAPDIFHARMAMGDRLAAETAVIGCFGKNGAPEGRRGRILVASQVIEQSLDLDFDAMVSDLAPIDLLLQRAGRLWRHPLSRPASMRPVAGPLLQVVSPDPTGPIDALWFKRLFPRAAAVYGNHLVLWRTAEILFRRGAVKAPDDIRDVIEHVYGAAMAEGAPEALLAIHHAALGRAGAERSFATVNLLLPDDGYELASQPWVSDTIARTRLSDPTRILRLARWDGVGLKPWAEAETPDRAWALSEVSVRATRVDGPEPFTGALAAAAAEAIAGWGRHDGEKILLPLIRGEGDWWEGRARDPAGRGLGIRYATASGLIL